MTKENYQGNNVTRLSDYADAKAMTVYCGSSCGPKNPGGWACWGFLARDTKGREVISDWGCLGRGPGMTNNVAEYHAVINALRWLAAHAESASVKMITSSKLVFEQTGGWRACKKEHLKPLLGEVLELLGKTKASLTWVSNKENEHADALARVAYYEAISMTEVAV
jgi:ribonuclease HI